ncbi:glycosyl hydrolase family 8 [Abyssalbus ytuae]|uniref:Glucanase n=1 Tax=Abyssalbus ytuae TaxID=2926907 RepID=A0A9E6ZKM1_9FLAO|nr:glycosyl hydrolase family 8 [Abyssalbus ytuae]UOB17462.1 glycosyl hydrolase family 8 [Abyssalbus ytuae]
MNKFYIATCCKQVLFTVFVCVSGFFYAQNKPFPQQLNFQGCIKPSNVSQSQMNTAIQNLYDSYKNSYLRQAPDASDQYYMLAQGNPPSSSDATVSEQHGYAMITMALMAGHDPDAKLYFDGMYKLYNRFRSNLNNNFMSWKITSNGSTLQGGQSAATDGDMDIAYSLLLAHDQWGGGPSGMSVTYLDEAKRIINALHGTNGEISNTTYRTLLGDWSSNQWATRSSDWMIDHMRAFKNATGDSFWENAENEVYNCIADLTGTGKPGANTGLVPDFATNDPAVPDSSGGGTGESYADKYYWNGCRYPWRIAMGYQHYGSVQAKNAITKLLDWATGSPTNGNPGNFNGGYNLDGTTIGNDTGELAFVGPITLAATVDSQYQSFLNTGWSQLVNLSGSDAYNDAIGLLSMLSISGNWWIPGADNNPDPDPDPAGEDITDLGGTVTSEYTDYPPDEGFTNLIDNDVTTKYLTFNASGWIQYEVPDAYIVTGYTISSANDVPDRDPYNWTFLGSNDGTNWTTLDTRSGEDFPDRYQTRAFEFNNSQPFSYYRFNLTNNSGNILQLSEIEIFGELYSGNDGFSTRIEAEDYTYMSGIEVEDCSEGGLNIGYIDAGDWMVWEVNLPVSGTYTVEYRVASESGGGTIQLEKAGGTPVYGTITVPATGDWQNWTTISHSVTLEAGAQEIAIAVPVGGYNINWLQITSQSNMTSKIIQDKLSSEISVYPLMVNDIIYIEGLAVEASVKIVDLEGRILLEKKTIPEDGILNISSIDSGIKILIIHYQGIKKTIKFIKK